MNSNLELIYEYLESIGDEIRAKLHESDKYTLQEMPEKIRSITGGGGGDFGLSTLNCVQEIITQSVDSRVSGGYLRGIIGNQNAKNHIFSTYHIATSDYRQITVTPTNGGN